LISGGSRIPVASGGEDAVSGALHDQDGDVDPGKVAAEVVHACGDAVEGGFGRCPDGDVEAVLPGLVTDVTVLHGFDLRIERQIAEGDLVETHWSLRGTHGGELEGAAPTGKSLCVDGQLLNRIADGKFVEEWVHWDTLGLLRQIGAIAGPSS
jgi:hypothetical protein